MLKIKTFLNRTKESFNSNFNVKFDKHKVKAIVVASVIAGTIIFLSPNSDNGIELSAIAKAQVISATGLEEETENAIIIQTDNKEELENTNTEENEIELNKEANERIAQYINVYEVEELNAIEGKSEAIQEAAELKAAEEQVELKAAEEQAAKEAIAKYSNKDIEILQRIVEAEATSEDTKGRILVANVVLNRLESKNFPNSIEGVVFQKKQFSPIGDGRYYSVKVTEETKEAVNRALQGEDYSNGALYFAARSMASSKNMRWFDNQLTYLFQHGCHEFFK